MNWIKSQIIEIEQDSSLKGYIYFLLAIHFFTSLFWHFQGLHSIIQNTESAVCWPFFQNCQQINKIINYPLIILLYFYFILSTLAVFLFPKIKNLWWMLLILEAAKLILEFTDYRTMGNYHFMPHIITLYFLFIPNKKFWIFLWLSAFYLGAASLKFNLEWLSGASLAWRIPFNNVLFLQALAFTVIPLELAAGFCLLYRNKNSLYLALFLLIPFHLVSFYWVGYFYPAVMSSLLSIIIFELINQKNQIASSIFLYSKKSLIFGSPLLLVFILSQANAFISSREFSLNGEKRLFSLNMFDANSRCFGQFIIYEQNNIREIRYDNSDLAVRVTCDPIFFKSQASQICKSLSDKLYSGSVSRVQAKLVSRRLIDLSFIEVINEENICAKS